MINLENAISRLQFYLEINFEIRVAKIDFSKKIFHLEIHNLEILFQSREKSRKTYLEMRTFEIINLARKKLGLSHDRIQHLEISNLDMKKKSRDFKISSRIGKISNFNKYNLYFIFI